MVGVGLFILNDNSSLFSNSATRPLKSQFRHTWQRDTFGPPRIRFSKIYSKVVWQIVFFCGKLIRRRARSRVRSSQLRERDTDNWHWLASGWWYRIVDVAADRVRLWENNRVGTWHGRHHFASRSGKQTLALACLYLLQPHASWNLFLLPQPASQVARLGYKSSPYKIEGQRTSLFWIYE